jgi:hypothetical protein
VDWKARLTDHDAGVVAAGFGHTGEIDVISVLDRMSRLPPKLSDAAAYALFSGIGLMFSDWIARSSQPWLNQVLDRREAAKPLLQSIYRISYMLGFLIPMLGLVLVTGVVMIYRGGWRLIGDVACASEPLPKHFRNFLRVVLLLLGWVMAAIAIKLAIVIAQGLPIIIYEEY